MPRKIRQIAIEGNLAYVPLTRGMQAVIDASDACLVGGINWQARTSGQTTYAMSSKQTGPKTWIARIMHRMIVSAPDGMQVDHIDGDGLNNRRSNLRIVTAAQNAQNVGTRRNNKSGIKGVCWHKAKGKWDASITVNRKFIHLGQFAKIEDAASAYTEASVRLHGEFARS